MSTLSKESEQALLHTLGLNYGDKSFRNHFVAGDGHSNMPHLSELVAAGLMEERNAPAFCSGDDRLFVATVEGRRTALRIKRENAPKLTRSQARYRRYLRVSDCFGSFEDFLQHESQGA